MNEYIKNMRKYVGHEGLLVAGASVFVYKNGKLLLQKRKDNGCWGDHGGCCELGESVEDTARRELYEETGLTARSLELLGVFSGKELDYTYPNGDMVSNVNIAYLCEDFIGDPVNSTDETTNLRWFEIDSLPDNISPPVIPALERCIEVLRKRSIKRIESDSEFIVEISPSASTIAQFVSILRAYAGEHFTDNFADYVAIDAPFQRLCYIKNGDDFITGIMFTCLDGYPHITAMATNREYQNKGYGKQLMNFFVEYVSRLGFHGIELYAWSEKTKPICAPTQAFYKSVGFTVEKEYMGLWAQGLITVKMKKTW